MGVHSGCPEDPLGCHQKPEVRLQGPQAPGAAPMVLPSAWLASLWLGVPLCAVAFTQGIFVEALASAPQAVPVRGALWRPSGIRCTP